MKISTLIAVVCLACSQAVAQDYPNRPIHLIIPFPAGGATDVSGRLVAESMKDFLPTPVVVENVSGAAGTLGAERVARSAPDGYTVLYLPSGVVAAKFTVKSFADFDLAKNLTLVSYLAEIQPTLMLVNSALPVSNLREFTAYGRANPGKMNFGASSSVAELDVGLFLHLAGIKAAKISYRGNQPAVQALAAGEIDFTVDVPLATTKAFMESGRIKAIGILTGREWPQNRALGLAKEVVPGYEMIPNWFGVAGPSGLPQGIVSRLSTASRLAINKNEVKAKLAPMGVLVADGDADELKRQIDKASMAWSEGAKVTGIRPE